MILMNGLMKNQELKIYLNNRNLVVIMNFDNAKQGSEQSDQYEEFTTLTSYSICKTEGQQVTYTLTHRQWAERANVLW